MAQHLKLAPAVSNGDAAVYADSLINILGIVSQTTAHWNYNIDGSLLPVGEPVRRLDAANEYELYFQDNWKLTRTPTVSAKLPPYAFCVITYALCVNSPRWKHCFPRSAGASSQPR